MRHVGWSLVVYALCCAAVDTARAQQASALEKLPAGAVARLGTVRFQNFGRIFAVAFSADRRTLAAGSWDGTITLWDISTRQLRRQWHINQDSVIALAFSPDGQSLASSGGDKRLRLWDRQTGKLVKELPGEDQYERFIGFSPDGRYLVSRTWRQLRLWDVSTGECRYTFKGTCGSPGFTSNGAALVFAVSKQRLLDTLRIIDVATGKEQPEHPLPPGPHRHLFSPSARYLARAGYDAFQIFDRHSGRDRVVLGERKGYDGILTAGGFSLMAFAPDERSLIVAAEKSKLLLLEAASGKVRLDFHSPDDDELCLAISPDGRWLATGSVDRSMLLWDLSGRPQHAKLASDGLSAKELERLWQDLDAADARRAYQAMWQLGANARESVPFLAERLQPIRAADAERTATLLRDLDADAFALRQRASAELEKLGPSVETALKTALVKSPSLEFRRRLERLLERLDTWWASQGRLLRALEVLERIASPEAQKVLRHLADGDRDSRLTLDARASLERLHKQTPAKAR